MIDFKILCKNNTIVPKAVPFDAKEEEIAITLARTLVLL